MAASDVLTKILKLPAEQRAKLALELTRSLDDECVADAAAAWDAEIERRAAEVEAGTAETMTLDEYRTHVRARRAARTVVSAALAMQRAPERSRAPGGRD